MDKMQENRESLNQLIHTQNNLINSYLEVRGEAIKLGIEISGLDEKLEKLKEDLKGFETIKRMIKDL
jgi:predicted nuclease with TOPRIM domain